MAAKKSATQHQRRGDWDKVKDLLREAFQTCTNASQGVNADGAHISLGESAADLVEQATIAVCELYRCSLASKDPDLGEQE